VPGCRGVLHFSQLLFGGPLSPVWHIPASRDAVPITHKTVAFTLRALLFGWICGLTTGAAAIAQVEGFRYTREVTVASPGWVRVPLDLAAVQHLAPGAADLHVLSPAGEEVPLQVEPSSTRSERRQVKAPKPRRDAGGGWELVLDLGADPVPHERLF